MKRNITTKFKSFNESAFNKYEGMSKSEETFERMLDGTMGSFCFNLAKTFQAADSGNRRRLTEAFPEWFGGLKSFNESAHNTEFDSEAVAHLIINAIDTHRSIGTWIDGFDTSGIERPEGVAWWKQLYKVIDTDNWVLVFEVEGKKHKMNRASVTRALKLFRTKHPRHYEDWVNENDDAITADVFLQLCVFGEVIFG